MIGAYLRLSLADEDIGDLSKGESNSIGNQRKVVMDFIKNQADLKDLPVQEFVDDGYSGTNTNRPAFQEMMSFVKQGKIKTIVVKDFSRFARDYIEAGDYIERIFPFLGVRFIAIHDYYDSNSHIEGSLQDMEIVIRNIINTAYSRDLSAKLASTHEMRRKRNQYSVGHRPYGFTTDPDDYTVLRVDPVAGKYIRTVFEMAMKGMPVKDIAKSLNEQGIPTASQYLMRNKVVGEGQKSWNMNGMAWTTDKVYAILSNEKYKGTYVARKVIRQQGSRQKRKNSEAEIIRVEDAHAAIVTPEEYELAQQVIVRKTDRASKTKRMYPLKGKVVCGFCGRKMCHTNGKKDYGYYICRYSACSSHDYRGRSVPDEDLQRILLRGLSSHLMLISAADKIVQDKTAQIIKEKMALENERQLRMEKYKSVMEEKAKCYEAYADGSLDTDAFAEKKKAFELAADSVTTQISAINDRLKTLVIQPNRRMDEMREQFMQVSELPLNEISVELAETFLDHITAYGREHVEIHWKYDDIIRQVMEVKS